MDITITGSNTEVDFQYDVWVTTSFSRCRDLGIFLETHILCLKNKWKIVAADKGNESPNFALQTTGNRETRRYAAILAESYIAGWSYAHASMGNKNFTF